MTIKFNAQQAKYVPGSGRSVEMLSDVAGMASSWWPAFPPMDMRLVEEVLDYLSYLQEVANAFSTELIWTLALVLGFTCLYIWRALGLQEAARKHSFLVSSRPVFTAVASPSVASASSSFVSTYKSRFAHKDIGREEERMNAVGYDVLHTYNVSPYPRHTVPRSVWKRHVTGTENEHLLQPQSGTSRNRHWDSDSNLPAGHWSNQPRDAVSGPAWKVQPPVPAQRSRRPETTEVKAAPVLTSLPYVFNRAPQHIQQYRHHPTQIPLPPPKPNPRVNHTCVSRRSDLVEGVYAGYTQPYGPEDTLHPETAPHEDMEMIDNQPVKLADNLFLLGQAVKEMKQNHKAIAERLENEGKEYHGDQIALDETKNEALNTEGGETGYQDKTNHPLPTYITDHKESAFSEEHQFTENNQGLKSREVEKRPRRRYVHPNEIIAEQNKNACVADAQSHSTTYSQSCSSKAGKQEQEMAELLRQKLLSQESSSRYKSSVLENFAKSYFTDHRPEMDQQEMDQETSYTQSQNEDKCSSETSPSKSKRDYPSPWKTCNIPVYGKRPKTVPTTNTSRSSMDESKNAHSSQSDNKELYDSAVLRAIKDEEESERSQNTPKNSLNTTEVSPEQACSGSDNKKNSKNGSADGEYDQTAVHEAGRRLAKLRKRLEDSLQLIQKQPSLDKELVEKTYSSKVRRHRDELESVLMKDVAERNSLGRIHIAKNETRIDAAAQPELTVNIKSSINTDVAFKRDDQQNNREVHDGEPSGPTGGTQTASSGNGQDLSGTAAKTEDSKVSEKNNAVSDHENDSSVTTDRTPQGRENEEPYGGKESASSQTNTADDELPAGSAEQTENKKDGEPTTERKIQGDKEEWKSDAKVSPIRRKLDEEHLDAILERQSKRREDLKRRKKIHMESMSAEETGSEDTPAHKESPDLRSVSDAVHPSAIKENGNQTTELHPNNPKVENDANITAKVMDDSKPKPSDQEASETTSRASDNTFGERSPLLKDMSGIGQTMSMRTLGYLKYEELEVQIPKADPQKSNTCSENRFMVMNGEMKLVTERECLARRRVRWRRQAERLCQEGESQKMPPPIPPKVTRLNDNVEESTNPSNLPHGDNLTESNQENCTVELKETGLNAPRVETKAPDNSMITKTARLVRGSFNCTIRDKNTVLGAGETGTVKGPPENVEICEEKSLTPSKAASVFNPETQLEKEKEKQDAERAVRANNREGMPPFQFKANLRHFEQVTVTTENKLPESKVKTNVKIFEEVSKAQRAHSVSPERKRNMRKLRSPSFPRPNLDCSFAK